MVRGTISEMTPGEAVTIVTIAGVTKRIPMGEVSYAGPADKAPAAPAKEADQAAAPEKAPAQPSPDGTKPFITVQGKAVPFKFVSQEPNLTLLLKTGEAEAVSWTGTPTGIHAVAYTPICVAPCEATLPSGAHQLALSKENGRPVATPNLSTLKEPSLLEGTYQSKQGLRTAGWVILIGGLAVGGAVTLTGIKQNKTSCPASDPYCVPNYETDFTGLYIGTGIMLGAGLVGAILALSRDTADIAISPRVGLH
jgi:hypothetical protein